MAFQPQAGVIDCDGGVGLCDLVEGIVWEHFLLGDAHAPILQELEGASAPSYSPWNRGRPQFLFNAGSPVVMPCLEKVIGSVTPVRIHYSFANDCSDLIIKARDAADSTKNTSGGAYFWGGRHLTSILHEMVSGQPRGPTAGHEVHQPRFLISHEFDMAKAPRGFLWQVLPFGDPVVARARRAVHEDLLTFVPRHSRGTSRVIFGSSVPGWARAQLTTKFGCSEGDVVADVEGEIRCRDALLLLRPTNRYLTHRLKARAGKLHVVYDAVLACGYCAPCFRQLSIVPSGGVVYPPFGGDEPLEDRLAES